MKSVFTLFAVSVLSLTANASNDQTVLKRLLDYKTRKVVCVAKSDRVTVTTVPSDGRPIKQVRQGRFFDDSLVAGMAKLAAYEPLVKRIHIRESIPNVRFEVNGLLITYAAGYSMIRDGDYSWGLVRLAESLCGPSY